MQFHSARSMDRGLSWLCARLKAVGQLADDAATAAA
jgi:hypothetical protein